MRYKLTLSIAGLALLFLCSCATGGGLVGNSSLEREVNVLKMEVANLKDQSGGGGGSGLRQEIDQMRTNIQRLNENVDTATIGGLSLRQQLEYLSARLDRLEKRANLQPLDVAVVTPNPPLPANVPVLSPPAVPVVDPAGEAALPAAAGAAAAASQPQALPGPPLPEGTIQTGPQVQAGPSGEAPAAVPAPAPVESAYDRAKLLFDKKDYASAVLLFQEYLKAEPTGKQAPAAQYYIGESLYFQSKFEDAILEYQTMITGFPKNTLVSAALLKQGLSFQAIGDTNSAKLLYNKVVREYPKSYSAGVAKERLKTL
ncbi:MAG: tol-pal system protein YbgF [Deltaproteobacteria bacterium]|jgi:tol-pal system protein YbgF|nr:tol-pal system protein YbgF [Deltaproteobacteria bacterium]